MYFSIDYYSYTIPTETPFDDGMFFTQEDTAKKIFLSSLSTIQSDAIGRDGWTHERGAKFYSHRLRHDVTGIALSYGKVNPHLLVELSGFACANLDARGFLEDVIKGTFSRCSRIDFAVDIETKTRPVEFIERRGNKSFKSSGHKVSPTGDTYYIGGRTSERMARVYRYNPPHPRSNLLRAEAEYKGDAAKASAEHYCTHGLQKACLDAHHIFQWEHDDWKTDGDISGKIPYKKYNPQNASTVRWLYGDVVTALRKAFKTGLVDPEEWLKYLKGDQPNKADDSPFS
ncbi:MAG TPA: hypothetical protein VKH37_07330 [Ferruginibacter sp.]|nr:hypothetical protein [Ferruginibacter sp.]